MKNILIIDPFSGKSFDDLLHRFGFKSTVLSEGRSALEHMQNGAPVDLVITELALSDMDGLDFVADIRRRQPDLPVIVITGQGSIESYLKAASLGIIEYLNKPVMKHELRRIVNIALGGTEAPRGEVA